jgi:hypothetical protein
MVYILGHAGEVPDRQRISRTQLDAQLRGTAAGHVVEHLTAAHPGAAPRRVHDPTRNFVPPPARTTAWREPRRTMIADAARKHSWRICRRVVWEHICMPLRRIARPGDQGRGARSQEFKDARKRMAALTR